MIVYFRLLAGLTSFISNLWRSHFSAIGPAGTLRVELHAPASLVKCAQSAMTMKPPAIEHGDRLCRPAG